MGNTSTKITTESLTNVINEEITNHNVKQLQSHKARSENIQRVIGITENGNVIIRNVNLAMIVNISLDSYQKTLNKSDLKSIIENSVDKYKDNLVSQSGVPLSRSQNEVVNKHKTNITNTVVNNISVEQINDCLVTAYNLQKIKAETKNGNITIENIDMSIVSNVSAKCVTNLINDIINSSGIISTVKEELKTKVETENKIPLELPDLTKIIDPIDLPDIVKKMLGLDKVGTSINASFNKIMYTGLACSASLFCLCLFMLIIVVLVIISRK